MHSQCIACVFLLVCLAAAATQKNPFTPKPQTSQVTGVLEPESSNLGSRERFVAAAIDILPDIAEVFERVGVDDFSDPERVQQAMLEFLPLTGKLLKARADVEGTEVNEEDLQKLNNAVSFMSAVNDFITRIRQLNLNETSDGQQEEYQ